MLQEQNKIFRVCKYIISIEKLFIFLWKNSFVGEIFESFTDSKFRIILNMEIKIFFHDYRITNIKII